MAKIETLPQQQLFAAHKAARRIQHRSHFKDFANKFK